MCLPIHIAIWRTLLSDVNIHNHKKVVIYKRNFTRQEKRGTVKLLRYTFTLHPCCLSLGQEQEKANSSICKDETLDASSSCKMQGSIRSAFSNPYKRGTRSWLVVLIVAAAAGAYQMHTTLFPSPLHVLCVGPIEETSALWMKSLLLWASLIQQRCTKARKQ